MNDDGDDPAGAPDLDAWLDKCSVRSVHRRRSGADPDGLWAAAQQVRVGDCRLLGGLARARIPGVSSDTTFAGMFASPPFCVLSEGPRHALCGLCGRIWSPRRDYGELQRARDFSDWDVPGTARVLFAHWCQPARGGAELVSEVRAAAVDGRGRIGLAAMDPFMRVLNRLICAEALVAAVRIAER